MKSTNRLSLMSNRLLKINEDANADQFGDEISKINDWFAKEYDASFSFEWNGKELKVLDGDKKETETINRADLAKKITDFPAETSESAVNEGKKLPSDVIKYCGKSDGIHYFITKESGIYKLSDGEVEEMYDMKPSELPKPDLSGKDIKTKSGGEAILLFSKGTENLVYFKREQELAEYSRGEMKEVFEEEGGDTSPIIKENRLSKFSDTIKTFLNTSESKDQEPTKIVVKDEHTLGYILPEKPDSLQILHDSILKGAPSNYNHTGSVPIGKGDKIRLATKKDFDDFRVAWSKSYENEKEYTYDHK